MGVSEAVSQDAVVITWKIEGSGAISALYNRHRAEMYTGSGSDQRMSRCKPLNSNLVICEETCW